MMRGKKPFDGFQMMGSTPTPGCPGATHLGEVSLAVANEKARLPAATVTDNDNLLGISGRLGHMGARGLAAG